MTPKRREDLRMMFGGRCAYCGCELPVKGWHADHVEPVIRETKWVRSTDAKPGRFVPTGTLLRPQNDTDDNLFPACRACNIDKGSSPLEDWRGWLQDRMVDSLRKQVANFRHAERFGIVKISREPLVFWFEKFREQQLDAA